MIESPYFVASPAPRGVWNSLVAQDKTAYVSHTPEWLDAICSTFGYQDASRLYEKANGQQFILPLVSRTYGLKKLASISSLPDGWGGVITTGALEPQDLRAIIDDVAKSKGIRFSLNIDPFTEDVWTEAALPEMHRLKRITHIVDIREGFQHYWEKQISSPTRNKMRKGEKRGVTVDSDATGQYIPLFYSLYRQWVDDRAQKRRVPRWLIRRLGERRLPVELCEQVSQHLGEKCRVWVAHYEGRPIAASIVLTFGNQAVYWRNASDRSLTSKTWANDMLQMKIIEAACADGCDFYDLGGSGGVPSLMYFKSRIGGQETTYHDYVLESLPIMPVEEQLGKMKKTVERLLTITG